MILSALLLAAIVGLFVMEIFMRYAMNAPTKWSNDVISFIMPAMIFLALPEVTRRKQHIAITFLVEALGESAAAVVMGPGSGLRLSLRVSSWWHGSSRPPRSSNSPPGS